MKTVNMDGQEIAFQERDFTIDPSNLDYDLCRMGSTLLSYAGVESRLGVEVRRRKSELESLYAQLDAKVRTDAKASGNKVTEKIVENTVILDPSYQTAVEALRVAEEDHSLARWAMIALQAKKDCLVSLTYTNRQLMKAGEY